MTKIIISGCNGHMGKTVSRIVSETPDAQTVAGVDINTESDGSFPVFSSIDKCDVEADVVIDFSTPAALDSLLECGKSRNIPLVLCSTGYDEGASKKIEEASKSIAVLRSANMSLGINLLASVLKEVSPVLAEAGFDIEIVESITV